MNNCSKRPISITDLANVLKNYITRKDFYNDYAVSEVTHSELLQLKEESKLVPSRIYLITDYWPIYKDPTTKVVKGTTLTSATYYIVIQAITEKELDPRVIMLPANEQADQDCSTWEVKYDITSVQVDPEVYNKGNITYLKDNKNNSAYFDFKNITFDFTKEEQELYGVKPSEYAIPWNARNVTIEESPGLYRIFIKSGSNIIIKPLCRNIVALRSVVSTEFKYQCSNIIINTTVCNTVFSYATSNIELIEDDKKDLLKDPFTNKIIYRRKLETKEYIHVLNYFDTETLTDQYLTL